MRVESTYYKCLTVTLYVLYIYVRMYDVRIVESGVVHWDHRYT